MHAIAAPAALVWEVLTDYDKLPRFVPGLASRIVQLRAGNRAVVEQKGAARFLVFSYPIEVRLEITEVEEQFAALVAEIERRAALPR